MLHPLVVAATAAVGLKAVEASPPAPDGVATMQQVVASVNGATEVANSGWINSRRGITPWPPTGSIDGWQVPTFDKLASSYHECIFCTIIDAVHFVIRFLVA